MPAPCSTIQVYLNFRSAIARSAHFFSRLPDGCQAQGLLIKWCHGFHRRAGREVFRQRQLRMSFVTSAVRCRAVLRNPSEFVSAHSLSRTNYLAQVVNRQCVPKGNAFGAGRQVCRKSSLESKTLSPWFSAGADRRLSGQPRGPGFPSYRAPAPGPRRRRWLIVPRSR